MDVSGMLASLDDGQRAAVVSTASPLAVEAPAGSGKTRVLTTRVAHRIATGSADPRHILCVTFTRKAGGELRQRLGAIGIRDRIEAGTFHSIALAQLRDRWSASGRGVPTLVDRTRPVISSSNPGLAPAAVAEISSEISWARSQLIRPDDYEARAAGRRTRVPAAKIADAWRHYDTAKTRSQLVDFDDLLDACATAIEGDAAFGAAQRWRFRHLFVDEFQDINPLQFRLLEAWRGDRSDVFVVGDPHQSIYGWNGAAPNVFRDLGDHWPALERMSLDRTHRSTPQITAAAAAIVTAAGLPDRHPTSTGAPGPLPRIRVHDDEVAEATTVARLIRQQRRPGGTWRSTAVLARTRDLLDAVETVLLAHGIPVRIRSNAAALADHDVRRVLQKLGNDERPLLRAIDELVDDSRSAPAVAELLDTADDHAISHPVSTGRSFAAWAWANLGDGAEPDAVTLSTIHGAKGLEWATVHVIGVEDGIVPLHSSRRGPARDEEARLLYVAATRAEHELSFHWAQVRTSRGVSRRQERSPFLDGFEDALDAMPAGDANIGLARIEMLRGSVPAPAPMDPVRARLVAWRQRRAIAADTVPEALLSDEALAAIAHARPTTIAELELLGEIGASRAHRFGPELLALVATPTRSPVQ